jgi:hypothetical protein
MNIELAVEPVSRKFNVRKDESAEAAFCQALADDFSCTETAHVFRPRDVMLNSRAEVLGRYKFTTSALTQLCSRLAPGASQMVADVAGLRDGSKEGSQFDVGLGIRTVNDLIRLRYDRVDGCGLVIDRARNTIEGLIGRKYEFFPNKDLYDRVNQFLGETGIDTSFCEAALSGRRMFLRYCNSDPLFEVTHERRTNEPFFGGFHFDNSEVGDCSVRAATMIVRQWCDNKSIGSFLEGGKISHVRGKQFEVRVQRLFEKVQSKAHEATFLKDNVVALMDQRLGFGGSEESHDFRVDRVVGQLNQRGLTKEFARSAVDRALAFGSYRADAVQQGVRPLDLYATRTAYDLFNAISHEAKTRSIDIREHAEQLSYQMLLKQFEIK